MHLSYLEARNFRNYEILRADPHPYLNIIRGRNAQGKSNFIEAVFYSLCGYSYRAGRESELIHWGCDRAFVQGKFATGDREMKVRAVIGPEEKIIELGGSRVRRRDLMEHTAVVLFTPEDLWLVKGGPRERRRFLDREIGMFESRYLDDLPQYKRALSQRNAALRRGGGGRAATLEKELWTEQVCRYGARILLSRLNLLREYVPMVRRLFAEWAGGELAIRYQSSVAISGSGGRAEVLEEALLSALGNLEKEELRFGRTLAGPHRDDLVFLINGRDARRYASQGQQRAIILALKLAQVEYWRNSAGRRPVVLLDDVLFELDNPRRQAVMQTLQNDTQVFLTVGDTGFQAQAEHKSFSVVNGRLGEEG